MPLLWGTYCFPLSIQHKITSLDLYIYVMVIYDKQIHPYHLSTHITPTWDRKTASTLRKRQPQIRKKLLNYKKKKTNHTYTPQKNPKLPQNKQTTNQKKTIKEQCDPWWLSPHSKDSTASLMPCAVLIEEISRKVLV